MSIDTNANPNDISAKEMFITLLKEVEPEKVLWKSMETEFTAQQIIDDFQEGGDIGKQYAIEFLRIARDLLAKKKD